MIKILFLLLAAMPCCALSIVSVRQFPGEFRDDTLWVHPEAKDRNLRRYVGRTEIRNLILISSGLNFFESAPSQFPNSNLSQLQHVESVSLWFSDPREPLQTTDFWLAHFAAMLSLRQISTRGGRFTDQGLKFFATTTRLEAFSMKSSLVTNRGLRAIARNCNLHTLALPHSYVSDEGLKIIGQFRALRSLDLEGTQITDSGISHLSQLVRLENLNFAKTQIGDTGIRLLASRNRNLRSIDLSGTHITDASLFVLANRFELGWINLHDTAVTAQGLRAIAESESGAIMIIDVTGTSITSAQIEAIKLSNPKIIFRGNFE